MTYVARALRSRSLLLLASGSTLILGDCDPTIQTTVENGVITLANGLLASFLSALVQLGQETADTTAMIVHSIHLG